MALATAALAWLQGCTCAADGSRAYACTKPDDCVDGFSCVDGLCQAAVGLAPLCGSDATSRVCAVEWAAEASPGDDGVLAAIDGSVSLVGMGFVDDVAGAPGLADGVGHGVVLDPTAGLQLGATPGCDGAADACAPGTSLVDVLVPFRDHVLLSHSFDDTTSLTIADAGARLTDGVVGSALVLNGFDDIVDGGTQVDPSGATALTLVAWSRPRSTTFVQGIAGWFDGANGFLLQTATPGGYLVALAGAIFGSVATSNHNRWTHTAVVFDGSGADNAARLSLYLNGVKMPLTFNGVVPTAVPRVNNPTFVVGRVPTLGRLFNGEIDEVAVVEQALTAAQVKALFELQAGHSRHSGTFTSRPIPARAGEGSHRWSTLGWSAPSPFGQPIPDGADAGVFEGLVGLWHLDDEAAPFVNSSGVVLLDGGTLSGVGAPNGNLAPGQPGRFGRSISNLPSGQGCIVGVGGPDDFNFIQRSGVFSVQAWYALVRVGGVGTHLVDTSYPGFSNGLVFYDSTPTNTLVASVIGRGSAFGQVNVPFSLRPRRWYHLVLTGDGTVTRLYVDGVPLGTSAPFDASQLSTGPSDFSLSIGCAYSGAYGLQGTALDEVAVWRRTLSEPEIRALHQRGASRALFSVRGCETADCTSASAWLELGGAESLVFEAVKAPFLQYRAQLESDALDSVSWPVVQSVALGPPQFTTSRPAVMLRGSARFSALTRFTETRGPAGCPAGVSYNLGRARPDGQVVWYWYDAGRAPDCSATGFGAWCPADGSVEQSNSAATVSKFAAGFISASGRGEVRARASLDSTGTTPCALTSVRLEGVP